MLFTKVFFHLECLLLFGIKSQPEDAYKSVFYNRAFNVVFNSSKNEKMTLSQEFIFVFMACNELLTPPSKSKPPKLVIPSPVLKFFNPPPVLKHFTPPLRPPPTGMTASPFFTHGFFQQARVHISEAIITD